MSLSLWLPTWSADEAQVEGALLQLCLPVQMVPMVSLPVLCVREDVLQGEGRGDELDEAPRESNKLINNKIT